MVGIAIYGGIIGAIVTAIIYCRKKKINFLKFCDFLAPYLALGQSIGRWGNFLNREAYGYETNSFFKMGLFDKSINKYIYVHPTFLYESVLTLAIFLILYFRGNKNKNDGEIFYLYMIMYGVGRAIIEGFRQDSLFLYNFRISQVIAMVFVIIFTILLYNQKAKRENT
jgi:phosphatidylglycerol:prolipoprotein diacylglycerol transferase